MKRRSFFKLGGLAALGTAITNPLEAFSKDSNSQLLDFKNKKAALLSGFLMAEREGFEPSVRVTAHPRSRRAPSTTQTSLRVRQLYYYILSN